MQDGDRGQMFPQGQVPQTKEGVEVLQALTLILYTNPLLLHEGSFGSFSCVIACPSLTSELLCMTTLRLPVCPSGRRPPLAASLSGVLAPV